MYDELHMYVCDSMWLYVYMYIHIHTYLMILHMYIYIYVLYVCWICILYIEVPCNPPLPNFQVLVAKRLALTMLMLCIPFLFPGSVIPGDYPDVRTISFFMFQGIGWRENLQETHGLLPAIIERRCEISLKPIQLMCACVCWDIFSDHTDHDLGYAGCWFNQSDCDANELQSMETQRLLHTYII